MSRVPGSNLGSPDQCDTARNMHVLLQEYWALSPAFKMEASGTESLSPDEPVIKQYDKTYTPL